MKKESHFLFFVTRPGDTHITIEGDESRHAVGVLRQGVGDYIEATDGCGTLFCCELTEVDKNRCRAKILDRRHFPLPVPQLDMYIGLPDKDAFGRAVEELVPVGVSRIIPVECRFSQMRWWAGKWEKQVERLTRKARTALKQSRRLHCPAIKPVQSFSDALESAAGTVLYADEHGTSVFQEEPGTDEEVFSCFVGPPGGFADNEIERLSTVGARPVRLGRFRLRTELAAVIMAAFVAERKRTD
jgi:16S rRNA (uracil1498-N3)-methyltransferase